VLTTLYVVGSYIVVKALQGKAAEKKEQKRQRDKFTPSSNLESHQTRSYEHEKYVVQRERC
jgi:hypothetical protein